LRQGCQEKPSIEKANRFRGDSGACEFAAGLGCANLVVARQIQRQCYGRGDLQCGPEKRPLLRWLSPQKLQVTIPNIYAIGLQKSRYEGIDMLLKYEPDDSEEREVAMGVWAAVQMIGVLIASQSIDAVRPTALLLYAPVRRLTGAATHLSGRSNRGSMEGESLVGQNENFVNADLQTK
jgi:hypothetical protein